MARRWSPALYAVAGCWILCTLTARAAADPPLSPVARDFFEKSVRPVLATHCFECHGPKKQCGGLRLDSRAAILEGGDTGPAVVPGSPDRSLLVKAVHYK